MSNFLYNSYRFSSANSARLEGGKGGITSDGRFGFDCSGFVNYVLKNSGYDVKYVSAGSGTFTKRGGDELTPTAAAWQTKIDTATIKAGDLVYFSGTGHVGFVVSYDAATKKGVFRSSTGSSNQGKGVVDAEFTTDPANSSVYWGGKNRFQAATRVTAEQIPGNDIWQTTGTQPAIPPLEPATILNSGNNSTQANVWLSTMAFIESTNNRIEVVRKKTTTAVGLYQMTIEGGLKEIGYTDGKTWLNKDGVDSLDKFLASPDIQRKAALEYLDRLRSELQSTSIDAWKYIGQVVNGRLITEGGLLAAAWNSGAAGAGQVLSGSRPPSKEFQTRMDIFRGTLAPGAAMANTLGSTVTSDQYQFGTAPGAGKLYITYGDDESLVAVFANGKRLTLPSQTESISVTPDGLKLTVTQSMDDGLLITRDYNANGRVINTLKQTPQGAASDGVSNTTRRNTTVLDVNTDTTNVRPERNAQFGANSNVSVGPAYVARMSHEMVNSDGLSNTLASANTAGKGRPGNLTPSNTENIVNAIRGDSMTTTKMVAASIPNGVVSSHYEDIYPPYPGEDAVPSKGYGLYNENGERIGYVATENANIGHRDSEGNWVTVHVAQAGKTYLFAKDADGKTVTTEMAPGSGSGTLLVNVKEGANAEGMLNNGSAGARDPYTDPLVLDEGDDGVRFGGNPVSFDLDGDGREDTLSWTAPTDPVLVYDANGDNRVNDGSELIDLTEDGTPHNLITLDGNGDKVLNSDDDAYWQIQIWRDSNADGYASEQERQSLAEVGIVSIDLDPAHYKIGNVGGQTAVQGVEATYGDGSKKMLWDVDFKERDAVTATTEYYAPGIDRISNGDQTALRITDSRGVAANLAGSGATQAIGGLGDDTLIGTAGDDWLIGGDGADKLQGGAGRDILVIDGEDLPSDIDGGADFDTAIVADDRGVMLNLYSANVEIVYGGYGNDVFVGGGADNYFIAGAAGDDLIVGGSADDALSGDDGDDVVSGGRGDDIIRGQRGDDDLSGGEGGDVLDGGLGDDILDGDVGDDVFIASGGRDTVIGGAGRDTLQLRGALADYRFVRESGGYVVTDTRNADGTLVAGGQVSDRDGEQHISGIETFSYTNGQMSISLNIDDVKPTPVADLVAIDGGLPCYVIEAATLTANDLDFQGGPLQISWVGEAIGGTVAMTSGLHTTITFTPTPGYVGPMQFSYRVRDPQGNGGVVIEMPEEPGSASEIKGLVRLVQSDAPSDPDYVKQWHLGAVGALEAWREGYTGEGYTGEGVKVLVLETSGKFAAYDQVADLNAADLAPNKSATFVDTEYHSTHATQVAGVIGAARNGVGGVGVAYDVTLDSKTIGFNLERVDNQASQISAAVMEMNASNRMSSLS